MKKTLISSLAFAAGLTLAGLAHADDIKIAAAGPLTGPNAAFGAQIQKGTAQAIADINAAGGVNGNKFVLSLGDDVSDPKQGVSVANKFVGDGVTYVVGHFNSGVSIPASDVYAENGVLQISPASTNPKFTERDLWNTFRTCGRDDQQGAVAGKYIIDHLKDKKIAIIHDKSPYGQGLADETKKAANAGGVTEVLYEGVNADDKDFSALISKMKSAGVEVIYFGGLHPAAGLIVRQASEQGLKAVLFSGDGITDREFAAIAGPAADGTLMTFGPDPRLNPDAKEVVERFRASGFEPEAYTLYSYASVQVIAQAIEKAGTTDPQKVAAVIKSGGPWKTVLGPLSYDAKGDRTTADYVVYSWLKDAEGKLDYKQL